MTLQLNWLILVWRLHQLLWVTIEVLNRLYRVHTSFGRPVPWQFLLPDMDISDQDTRAPTQHVEGIREREQWYWGTMENDHAQPP